MQCRHGIDREAWLTGSYFAVFQQLCRVQNVQFDRHPYRSPAFSLVSMYGKETPAAENMVSRKPHEKESLGLSLSGKQSVYL